MYMHTVEILNLAVEKYITNLIPRQIFQLYGSINTTIIIIIAGTTPKVKLEISINYLPQLEGFCKMLVE